MSTWADLTTATRRYQDSIHGHVEDDIEDARAAVLEAAAHLEFGAPPARPGYAGDLAGARTVEYARLVTVPGQYENERCAVSVEVQPGETAEGALQRAQEFVNARLGQQIDLQGLRNEVWSKGQAVKHLDRQIEARKEKLERIAAFCQHHKITLDGYDDLPF